jgi:hypothetical protein
MFFRASDFLPERGKMVILQYMKRGKPAVTTAFCTEDDRWIDTRIQRDITDSLTSETFWCDFHDDEE